jgi:perosamine synthetase
MVADYLGAEYCISTVNGTGALHVALLAAGIQPDDEVLVSSLTFIATANAIRYVGAWPVFIDAEPNYWQMDPRKILDFLEGECRPSKGELFNKATGRRIKAILPVHILGHSVEMGPVMEIAGKYNLAVIEDAAESLGAKCDGRMVGTLGDIACFSFNGNKIITTGGGGMVATNRQSWAWKAKYLTTQAKDDPVEYIHNEIGYNYRLTNIQAAFGCAQMEKLDQYIAAKRRIARTYREAFRDIPGITPMGEARWAVSTHWMYTVLVKSPYRMNSRRLLSWLGEAGIEARPLWQPLHLSPAHSGAYTVGCGVAEQIFEDALSLPCSVSLSSAEQSRVIQSIIGN